MGVDLLNVKGLQEMDQQAPVVMVNLMRFRERSLDGDGSGWDAYLRYSALTVPMIKARGGTLLWTGDAKTVALGRQDGNQWDYLALVYYPTVSAFVDMMTSADYETPLRPPPHQRLRRTRDHRDEGGLQQVQAGVRSSAPDQHPPSVMLREGGASSTPRLLGLIHGLWNTGSPAFAGDDSSFVARVRHLKTSAPDPA